MSAIQGVQRAALATPATTVNQVKQSGQKAQAARSETTAEEAKETAAATKTEAQRGDQEDVRKLQAQASSQATSPAAAQKKGGVDLVV